MNKSLFLAAALAAVAPLYSGSAAIQVKDGEAIAFMGDSITAFGNYPAGYVNLVMKGLEVAGVKNVKKIPAGISGHKSPQMNARLQNDVLSKKPQWMTFSCGVNDVWHGKNGVELEKYQELVSDIFDRCAAAGVKVVVLTATMIGEDANNANNKKLAGYNEWLRAEAKKRGLPLADLNADMQAELQAIRAVDKTPGNKLTRDGVHMAFPGDCMMAWGVLRALGVEEADKARIVAAWRKLPGAYEKKLAFSAEQWDAVKPRLDASCDASGYVRKLILDAPFPKAGGSAMDRRAWAATLTEKRQFVTSDKKSFQYRWYAPPAASGKLPLVVFLHGAGERGSDNTAQLIHGVPQFLNWSLRTGNKFYLVAGQVPSARYEGDPQGQKWVQVPWNATEFQPMPEKPSEAMKALIELIGQLREDPRIDASRIYVTGLSMGGYGTWDLILRKPDWFAAALVCCGGGDNSKVSLVKDLPIRIVHGGADTVVPTVRGRGIFEALKAVGGKAEYFEYPGVGHGCWGPCYDDDKMLEWMFGQKR